jgi:hypothetical protein
MDGCQRFCEILVTFLLEKENGINLTGEFKPIKGHKASNLTPKGLGYVQVRE